MLDPARPRKYNPETRTRWLIAKTIATIVTSVAAVAFTLVGYKIQQKIGTAQIRVAEIESISKALADATKPDSRDPRTAVSIISAYGRTSVPYLLALLEAYGETILQLKTESSTPDSTGALPLEELLAKKYLSTQCGGDTRYSRTARLTQLRAIHPEAEAANALEGWQASYEAIIGLGEEGLEPLLTEIRSTQSERRKALALHLLAELQLESKSYRRARATLQQVMQAKESNPAMRADAAVMMAAAHEMVSLPPGAVLDLSCRHVPTVKILGQNPQSQIPPRLVFDGTDLGARSSMSGMTVELSVRHAQMPFASFQDVEIRGKGNGDQAPGNRSIELPGSAFQNVVFRDVDLTKVYFSGSKFDHVQFIGGSLVEANFDNAVMGRTSFFRTDATYSYFQQIVVVDSLIFDDATTTYRSLTVVARGKSNSQSGYGNAFKSKGCAYVVERFPDGRSKTACT